MNLRPALLHGEELDGPDRGEGLVEVLQEELRGNVADDNSLVSFLMKFSYVFRIFSNVWLIFGKL